MVMLVEAGEIPGCTNTILIDMIDEDELDDDIVEITIDDIEQIEQLSDGGSQPASDKEEDEDIIMDDDADLDDEVEDDAILKFTRHSGDAFCCDLHPSGSVAVTGGEDDKAFIWLVPSGQVIKEVDSFEDSVSEVGFSFDGKYVAMADMTGNIQVMQVEITSDSPEGVLVTEVWTEKVEEIQWMQWHQGAHVLLVGGAGAAAYMWKIPSGECKVLLGESECTAGQFMPDGKTALLGYGSGSVKVFNLINSEIIWQFKLEASLGSIISVACHPSKNYAAAGDNNGKVAFFSTRMPMKVHKVINFAEGCPPEVTPCIENLFFSENCIVATTPTSLFSWDLAKQSTRDILTLESGITKVVQLKVSLLLLVGSGCGSVSLVSSWPNIVVYHTFCGHTSTILSLTCSGGNVLSTSDDKTCRLFYVPEIILQALQWSIPSRVSIEPFSA